MGHLGTADLLIKSAQEPVRDCSVERKKGATLMEWAAACTGKGVVDRLQGRNIGDRSWDIVRYSILIPRQKYLGQNR